MPLEEKAKAKRSSDSESRRRVKAVEKKRNSTADGSDETSPILGFGLFWREDLAYHTSV